VIPANWKNFPGDARKFVRWRAKKNLPRVNLFRTERQEVRKKFWDGGGHRPPLQKMNCVFPNLHYNASTKN
jgi:hypothetical protein